jgi:hypothetical protein
LRLGCEQNWRVFVCQELLDEVRNDQNFLSGVISGDEVLQPRNQTAVLSLEKPILSIPKESKASQDEYQEHAGDL